MGSSEQTRRADGGATRVLRFKHDRTWHLIGEPIVVNGRLYQVARCGSPKNGQSYQVGEAHPHRRICRACLSSPDTYSTTESSRSGSDGPAESGQETSTDRP